MKGFVILILLVHHSLGDSNPFTADQDNASKDNWISRLYKDKLKGYNKGSRPVHNHDHNTTVYLALSLNHIDVDDLHQELSVNAWSIMTWVDEYLKWEPKNYMNIDSLHFDDDDIWMPDITLYNSAQGSDVQPFGHVPVLANSVGQTYWFPPTHFVVKCDLDLRKWPSDQHDCLVMVNNYEENKQWTLVKVSATRSLINIEGHDSYVEIDYTFTVKRHAKAHATYITQTTLVIILVVLVSYFLPLDCFFSRMLLHLFAMGVLISCYFTLFNYLPDNGGPVPLVVRYYSGTLILTTISLLSTIFLTSQGNCCSSTTSVNFSRKLIGAISSAPVLRNSMPQQPYNHLEAEMVEEGEATQTESSTYNEDPGISSLHIKRVVNFLLLVLFTVAYLVDYVVLRSVTI
ncbi:Neuronal acetylcholine receptor subunit alpha-7-like 1 [Homarus americanus]|uniref:Neuronal acetylcholine receptor subunit alpha-7-like 1 n=1 Tax=Homarus americanus TaxID=6706 RepID=A0A8J5JVC6_HOMAM|nr:Neuronal acetylcholine receptor subunit alpha-7-like 1 [Homarus americanus]